MPSSLPTLISGSWSITAFRDSLLDQLHSDAGGAIIRMFFYAVTESGWETLRSEFKNWKSRSPERRIIAYVGTDHGITEVEAVKRMRADGVVVRLMTRYRGVFHPKLVWLEGTAGVKVWVGSNNLTRDGLSKNIEFGALLESRSVPSSLTEWADRVHSGSEEASAELLKSYETERRKYGEKRVLLGTFTWSRREHQASDQPSTRRARGPETSQANVTAGDLILEVMPRETGVGGKQIQLPMRAATDFFGMSPRDGARRRIRVMPSWIDEPRSLTMTIFRNRTVRLVIRELDYRDRPCVLHFQRVGDTFKFEIVSRSVEPVRYRHLLNLTGEPTREGSRRWVIVT